MRPDPPLSPAEIDEFKQKGFLVLRAAFDAAAFVSHAEAELALLLRDGPPRDSYRLCRTGAWRFDVKTTASRVHAAICQLLGGEGRLRAPLDGFHTANARCAVAGQGHLAASDDWHVDGWHDPHKLTSGEVGLVVLWLLTPAPAGGGGTVFAEGSVQRVARLLAKQPRGLRPHALHASDAEGAERAIVPSLLRGCRPHCFVGAAGDVALCHPFLIHRGDRNVSAARPRILAVSHCPLAAAMRVRPGDDDAGPLSPVEESTRAALHAPLPGCAVS